MEPELAPEKFPEILAELSQADEEHGSVALVHESEWALSYGISRTLIYENVESDDSKDQMHMTQVPVETVIALWQQLARGEIEAVRRAAWQPGYGS